MNPRNPHAITVRQSTGSSLWEVIEGDELIETFITKNNAVNFAKDYAEGLPGAVVTVVDDRRVI